MKSTCWFLTVIAIGLAIVGSGCGDNDNDNTQAPSSTLTPTAIQPLSPTPSPTAMASPTSVLPSSSPIVPPPTPTSPSSTPIVPSPAPGVEPQTGCYLFNHRGCFAVDFDDPAAPDPNRKVLVFGADCASAAPGNTCTGQCFRSDEIHIAQGAFSFQHGDIDGTDCPTDGYVMSGSFTTDTQAEGTIVYVRDCRIVDRQTFIAMIPPEPTASPAGEGGCTRIGDECIATGGCTCTLTGCRCPIPPITGAVCTEPPRH
jgi:hypothetical protein